MDAGASRAGWFAATSRIGGGIDHDANAIVAERGQDLGRLGSCAVTRARSFR